MHLQLGQNQVLVDCHLIPTNGQRGVKEPWCWVLYEPKLHAQKKLTYNFLTIAFSSYKDSWRQMRKLFMTELFTKSKMQSFECTRKVNVTQLIDSIAQNSPNLIDLSEKALTLTYSIIYHIAFNRELEIMKKLREVSLKSSMKKPCKYLARFRLWTFFHGSGDCGCNNGTSTADWKMLS